MEKKNIAVLFGGVSSEHAISLLSAATVLRNLNTEKFNVYPVGITRDGAVYYYQGDYDRIEHDCWENEEYLTDCVISCNRLHRGLILLDAAYDIIPIDCVIPVLHGKNGEDGTVQGLLQMAGIPFVGCDTISSANCMDKEMTHIILERAGVPMAKFVALRRGDDLSAKLEEMERKLGWPMFVKPANAGSSVGVSKASNREELKKGIALAFEQDSKVIVEETIVGKEVECAVLGNQNPDPSMPGEIQSANEFYDFEGKYENADSKLFIPARISEEDTKVLRELAVKAYRAMGCSGLSRVDFFVTDHGPVLNEINTLPGFTSISMYPKLRQAGGLSIPALLEELIRLAEEGRG